MSSESSLESTDIDLTEMASSLGIIIEEAGEQEMQTASGNEEPSGEKMEPSCTPSTSKTFDKKLPAQVWESMTHAQRRNYSRRFKRQTSSGKQEGSATPKEALKRPRETSLTTPSPKQGDRKKPKLSQGQGRLQYSQIACHSRVAIIKEGYPDKSITPQECELILARIGEDGILGREEAEGTLNFCGRVLREGALIINCEDEATRQWLTSWVLTCSPLDGALLKTCDPKDLEGYKKIAAFFPAPCKETPLFLQMVQKQNPGLKTARWKILGQKDYPRGRFVVASIPESQHRILSDKNFRIKHLCDIVTVKDVEQGKPTKLKEGKAGEGSSDPKQVRAVGGGSSGAPSGDGSEHPRPLPPGLDENPAEGGGVGDSGPDAGPLRPLSSSLDENPAIDGGTGVAGAPVGVSGGSAPAALRSDRAGAGSPTPARKPRADK